MMGKISVVYLWQHFFTHKKRKKENCSFFFLSCGDNRFILSIKQRICSEVSCPMTSEKPKTLRDGNLQWCSLLDVGGLQTHCEVVILLREE